MRTTLLLSIVISFFSSQIAHSQNYLRVGDPDSWETPASNEPLWESYMAHGKLEDVTIIAEPQGIYTEIGFYSTISQGPDAWSWQGEYEIIWQFDLPGNTIIHDSWLWIEQDIIKADVVDFWTALETYEDIVDRNQDPSFFYQLTDGRYEIRIYPLFEGESRRIKMSFLVPTTWDVQTTTSSLLQNLLQSTDYPPEKVGIGMPVNELWQSPNLKMDNILIPMTDTVLGGSGDLLHYLEVPGVEFISANNIGLVVDAPLSAKKTFLSTYTDAGENYYQLAFVPDWAANTQSQAKKNLILLDYDDFKTSLSKEAFLNHLQNVLGAHFSESDALNAAVITNNGIQFLSDIWWEYDALLFADTLESLLNEQDGADLEQLLSQGFSWAQNQGDINHIYLFAANDDFVYPPIADDVFSNIENLLMPDVPLTLMDYQDENVSIVYYNNEAYHGNDYFYQLLSSAFSQSETVVYRESNEEYAELLTQLFPELEFPTGIMDYTTTLTNGIAYQRYSINSVELNPENKGVILQTGKYLGDFPMNINASLITDSGQFWNINTTVESEDILVGDTLMKEMWYGPYLRTLEAQVATDEDREYIIEQSIKERVLTRLTAFLALEPDQGGEPCIGCLYNNGEIILISVNEQFISSDAKVLITPNPASFIAKIQLIYKGVLIPNDWTAMIYDASGRVISTLDLYNSTTNKLEWQWLLGNDIEAGIYFCKIKSDYGEIIGKIVVLPK
jgi:hypothetical protein